MELKSVAVYCGSSPVKNPAFEAEIRSFGREIAARGVRLVYGGSSLGLMGALADETLAAGGQVTGVIPKALEGRESAHRSLTELRVVDSMHAREQLIFDLSDAFVAMPGGFGTYEEFFEAVTWTQLGVHSKPCGLLNVEGFYDPIVSFIDRAVSEQFVKPEYRAAILVDNDPERLVGKLDSVVLPEAPRWIGLAQS